MIILGIDPGSATTGFSILEKSPQKNSKVKVVDFGCIITKPDKTAGQRLNILYNELNKIIKKYEPKVLAIESLFFFKNLKTAMPVSQAKGVILFAAAKKKMPIYEFTPLEVKMAITGYGKAEKKQVQKMAELLLDLDGFDRNKNHRKKDDAIDALCIGLCFAMKKDRNLI